MMEWLNSLSTEQTKLGGLVLFNTVALVFLITSSLLRNLYDLVLHRRKLWAEREVTHLENQLSTLYGPIYSLLKANEIITSAVRENSAARDYQQALWKDVIIPNNTKVLVILQSNFHLLASKDIPSNVLAFMAHAEWQRIAGGTSGTVPSGVLSFPKEFAEVVYKTTETLKMELSKRRSRVAP